MKRLEGLIHPLYRAAEEKFLADAEKSGARIAVLDVPLLLETGGADRVDAVVVVTAPEEIQHARLMERAGMTREKLLALLAKQMPDAEKRKRADFIVDTSQGLDSARAQVRAILEKVESLPKRRKA
jgi:dephospho-CoA kinase